MISPCVRLKMDEVLQSLQDYLLDDLGFEIYSVTEVKLRVKSSQFLFFVFCGPFWTVILVKSSKLLVNQKYDANYLFCPSCELPQIQFYQNYEPKVQITLFFFFHI